MRTIFISYRRADAEGQAGRLFSDLVTRFGKSSVFMDVAGIEPGRDFRRVIDEHVSSCGVLLAVIGTGWIDTQDERGQRRLDDPMDFVRLETASALKRDIPVVPVLVHGARMPRPEQLPNDLAELAYRNGVELTHARWDSDVEVLCKAMSAYVEHSPKSLNPDNTLTAASTPVPANISPSNKKPMTAIVAASLVALAIAIGGYVIYRSNAEKAERTRVAEVERIATEKAIQQVEAEKIALEKARQQAEAERVAAARANIEAERLAAEGVRQAAVAKLATEKARLDSARTAADSARQLAEAANATAARERPQSGADSQSDRPVADIRGIWRDSDYPANTSQIIQDGTRFHFTRRGILPNGIAFESAGSGTLTGQRFTSSYTAKYQSGATSAGNCTGAVSPNGTRFERNCRDSLLGAITGSAIRQ